ncbi:MAG: hypothetical protein RL318_535 [Fibrobacterota bacterium]|jgi:hypothetical protein
MMFPKRRFVACHALFACAALSPRAGAQTFEGMATHFNGVGYPYGACGVPDEIAWNEAGLDTATGQGNPFHYVALNVFDTPGNYASPGSMGKRPLTGTDTLKMGTYRNGLNCGRWMRITFGQECDGQNDGAQNQPFCRGGTGWFTDGHTGGSVHAVVFDQCSDGNAWCRDSKHHLDLHTPLLNRLRKDGQLLPPLASPTGKVDPNNPYAAEYHVSGFNNRKVAWEFMPAPGYRGEPRFYFSEASKNHYMRVIVTHLPNGIHKLQQWDGTIWKDARMEGDAGQMWILPNSGQTTFKVRIIDVDDVPAMGGRVWTFEFPGSCGGVCSKPATLADKITGTGGTPATAIGTSQGTSCASAYRLDNNHLLHLGNADGSGWIELISPSGRSLVRSAIRHGKADLSKVGRGVWIALWKTEDQTGKFRLVLP